LLSQVQEQPPEVDFEIDLLNISWTPPFFILPVCAYNEYLKNTNSSYKGLKISNSYLNTLCFHECGLKPDENERWKEKLQYYIYKNYIPIINFSTQSQHVDLSNDVFSLICKFLFDKLKIVDTNHLSTISFIISEITDNIIEHSSDSRGFMTAQYYPTKEYLDICILDTGISILGSYLNNGIAISDHAEAINNAINGKSTKNISGTRGTGIPNSKNILLNAIKGHFIILSGDALLFDKTIFKLPCSWPGTILALRIPKNMNSFNLYEFIS
jgi:hypothetical protein